MAWVRVALVFQHLGGPTFPCYQGFYDPSIRDNTKKSGPPPTGKGVPILVRLQPPLLADVDQWIARQDIPFTRPEAIRRLIEIALTGKPKRQSNCGEK